MKKNYVSLSVALCLSLTLMSGCARKIGGNQYNSSSLSSAAVTYQGVIVSARKVEVNEADRLQDNSTGAGLGGVAGALAGSAFGNGRGQLVGMGVGALVGSVAGAYAQEQLGKQEGVEYVVKLASGEILTVVQSDDQILPVGQRVFVSVNDGPNGRPRVIADNSGLPMSNERYQKRKTDDAPMVVINNNTK